MSITAIVLATSLSVDALGVVGLTAALKIQLHGNYRVTVISEIIPSDSKSIKYTSRWAVGLHSTTNYHVELILLQGAHHVYNSLDEGIHGQSPIVGKTTLLILL